MSLAFILKNNIVMICAHKKVLSCREGIYRVKKNECRQQKFRYLGTKNNLL